MHQCLEPIFSAELYIFIGFNIMPFSDLKDIEINNTQLELKTNDIRNKHTDFSSF
jgi:hypothetical protein